MKRVIIRVTSILILSIFLSLNIFSGIAFAVTKTDDGNYIYTPEEVNDIRKTLEKLNNEIDYERKSHKIDNEKYEQLLKSKEDFIKTQSDLYSDTITKNEKAHETIEFQYTEQISNWIKINDNNEQKYELMKTNADNWKDTATKLNDKINENRAELNFYKTSVLLLFGVLIIRSVSN